VSTEANKDVSTEAAVTAAPDITTSQISQTMMGIAIVWFVGACALGISDVLLVYTRILFLFVVIPVIIFGTVFAFSPRLRAWAFALDSRLIVLLNMLRAGGLALTDDQGRNLAGRHSIAQALEDFEVDEKAQRGHRPLALRWARKSSAGVGV
jgi:hypothetical protein